MGSIIWRPGPNQRPKAYMKNMEPKRPPLAKLTRHWLAVECCSASPRCASYRAAAPPWIHGLADIAHRVIER